MERRRQVVRQRVRRRRRGLLLIVAGLVLAFGLWKLSNSSLFGLSSVSVTGVKQLSSTEVRSAAGVRVGEPVLRMDLKAIRARVEELPWVAHAAVVRVAPSGLRVEVTEYAPAASVAAGGRFWLVAADGTVLAPRNVRPAGVPFINGVPAAGLKAGDALPGSGPFGNALAALRGMRPELRPYLTSVTARSEEGLTFGLKGGGVLQYGVAERQAAKDEAALLLLRDAAKSKRKVVRIDVRAPRTPVLQAKKSGAVVENEQPRR
jgi:cell division protein FtsQ